MSFLDDKWQELKDAGFDLGDPVTEEEVTPEGEGRTRGYAFGRLYGREGGPAREVHGAILGKYQELGETASFLGYPTSDEASSRDGIGRYNTFENGAIYWHPEIGTHEVRGAICAEYVLHGAETGPVGYPISDEFDDEDGKRRSEFVSGHIVWSPDEGARYFVQGVEEIDPVAVTGNPNRFKGFPPHVVDFYLNYSPFAEATEAESGVPVLVSLGQAALESGWSAAKPGNNMFGIKAGSGWTGARQLLTTKEYLASPHVSSFPKVISVTEVTDPADPNFGKFEYIVKDWFRAYDSPKESFDDHATLLRTRYSAAFDTDDPYEFARAVANGGYATIGAGPYFKEISGVMDLLKKVRAAAQADD